MTRTFLVRSAVLAAMASTALASGPAPAPPAGGALRVLKREDSVLVRTPFDPAYDLVTWLRKGGNNALIFNVWRMAPTQDLAAVSARGTALQGAGASFHNCGDDVAPWLINDGFIGGNHGCPSVCRVASPRHGLAVADIGGAWRDPAGTRFTLIRVVDPDTLWFLSDNTGTQAVWRFTTAMAGTRLTNEAGGAALAFTNVRSTQLHPACRVVNHAFLADGRTPVPDGAETECAFLDVVDEYEIINPGAVLKDIQGRPGIEPDFAAARLDAVISNRIVYRFFPRGAMVVEHTAKALQDFHLRYMGFIQSARLVTNGFDVHEYYIPKTRPVEDEGIEYDFRAPLDVSTGCPYVVYFNVRSGAVEDPGNLPDRFIEFLGRRQEGTVVREIGYALGYSLVEGLTRPEQRATNSDTAISFYPNRKSYPVAINQKMAPVLRAGTELRCVAYRQYFKPPGGEAPTCVYWHPEGDAQIVYADYHRAVERDVIRLPAAWAGRPVTVIEKTPSLTLHEQAVGPLGELTVSVTNAYGYGVFHVREVSAQETEFKSQ